MSTNKTTANNAYSSQPAAQHTGEQGGILNKVGGLGNIIHGAGKIIHGHVPGAGDTAHSGKAAIKTAGRQEVEHGLDRIEGKTTDTFAAAASQAPAQDWERGGAGDGAGAAPTTAPRASTTAPRADSTSQKAGGAAADIRHPVGRGALATAGAAATGTRGNGPAPEQRHDDSERTQAAATTAPPHVHPIASNGPGVQRDTDLRQQGNGMVAGDQDKLDEEAAAMALPSNRPTAVDDPGAQRDIDVRQQVERNGSTAGTSVHDEQTRTPADASDPAEAQASPGGHDSPATSGSSGVQSGVDVLQQGDGVVSSNQDELDRETAATASPSDSDRPAAVDGLGTQRDTNVRQQVQGNGPATGTSVQDEQTRTPADDSDPAEAQASPGGHDSPATSGSPGVQSDADVLQQGDGIVSGHLDKFDRETAATASPNDSDRPTAADGFGAQRDTDFRQQVQGNGPATGTSVHDERTHTTTDASDPVNAALGGHDRPAAPSTPGVDDIDVLQQGNWTVAGDRDKLDKEGAATTPPSDSDRPTVADGLGAQRDIDVRQQVQGNGSATGTSVRDEQTRTTADASDPANAQAAPERHDSPATSGSPGVQGDTDVLQQGSGTVAGDQEKLDKELAATASPSDSDRPTVADAQRDVDVLQQGSGMVAGDQDKFDKEIPATASPSDGDRPTVANGLGAQRDTDVRQQVEGNGPAAGTSVRDEQTRIIADASDPANAQAAPERHDSPATSGSPGVQGDADVLQQGSGTVAGDQEKLDKELAATASPSDSDRPTVADAQRDTDVRQQVEGSGPAAGTSVRDEQTYSTADALDPANAQAAPGGVGGHDSPAASPSLGVQGDTDVLQQGSGTVAGDQDKLDKEIPATALPSDSDRPTAADGPGAQRDTDVRQQVERDGPAAGTSVRDEQTHSTADASDPANAQASLGGVGGHDSPAASHSLGVQGDTDALQQGSGTVAGDQEKPDKEIAATASPSDGDRPTVANGLGVQRDTDVRQQVEGNGPAAGTSVRDEQTHSTADASDLTSAQAAPGGAGGHDSPAASPSLGVQGGTDVLQQGNETIVGDQDKLDRETAATASPRDRPTAVEDPGAQRDKQTHTTAGASDPASAAAGGHDQPASLGSLGIQGDTDVRQQGNGSASSDRDKTQETRTTADTPDLVNTVTGQEQHSGMAPQA